MEAILHSDRVYVGVIVGNRNFEISECLLAIRAFKSKKKANIFSACIDRTTRHKTFKQNSGPLSYSSPSGLADVKVNSAPRSPDPAHTCGSPRNRSKCYWVAVKELKLS